MTDSPALAHDLPARCPMCGSAFAADHHCHQLDPEEGTQ